MHCTVKQISDNEIYLLIIYMKSILWRVAKCLSYIEEVWCLKVKLCITVYYLYLAEEIYYYYDALIDIQNANYPPPPVGLSCTMNRTTHLQPPPDLYQISQDNYLLAGDRQNWDGSGYWSECVVTIFYAVYHFCTSQLLSTSAVLYIVLKL